MMRGFLNFCILLLLLAVSAQPAHSFDVTPGHSGAWYDLSHSGEGFFLEVLNDTTAVVFWFTYDTEGNQVWMLGVGEIDGSQIHFPTLEAPHGGKFGPEFDPEDVEYPVWGTLTIEFSSCAEGTAEYSGPDEFGSGNFQLSRLTQLWGLECGQFNSDVVKSNGTGFLSPGFSGAWYDLSHSGEGFVVEVLNETTAVVIWFTYTATGDPAWMIAVGEIVGSTILISNFEITSGGQFGPEFDPDDVVYESWGPAAFTFGSCGQPGSAGSMRYIPPSEFGSESLQLLYRLTGIAGLGCGFLSDTFDVTGKMTVAENLLLDGDVNDPNVPVVPNNADDGSFQQLPAPVNLTGYATAVATGQAGDRFESETDQWDWYAIPLRENESVRLNISDWAESDAEKNDLDLYLYDVEDVETLLDSSLNVTIDEWVTAPEDGIYFVGVHAYNGSSNYSLRSGLTAPQALEKLTAAAEFVEGELIGSLLATPGLTRQREAVAQKAKEGASALEKSLGLQRIAQSADFDVRYKVEMGRVDRLQPHPLSKLKLGFGTISPEQWRVIRAAKRLAADGSFEWSGPNYIQRNFAEPNDPIYPAQWHYPLIRLPRAWDITTGDTDVVVAVVDSGIADLGTVTGNVDYSLGYDFVSNVLAAGDLDGIDQDATDPGPIIPLFQDYRSHGTHVAGTVGEPGNDGISGTGVNWNVTIMPVRVLGPDGGWSGSCWDVLEGLKWAGRLDSASETLPNRAADVINLSLGGFVPCPGHQLLVNELSGKGIIVVAAAGNERSSVPNYPASLQNVVSVSATTITDELAPYSSFGSTLDIAAPGGDINVDLNVDGYADGVLAPTMVKERGSRSTFSTGVFLQGTSMAAPHVSGVAALMKSVFPEMGPNDFDTAISSGSITVDLAQNGGSNKDPQFGYGRIDAQKAVNWALEQAQGTSVEAYVSTSISSAQFSDSQQSIDFQVEKHGSGQISIAQFGTTEPWLTISQVNADSSGMGTYRLSVNRTGLVDGLYSAWAAVESSTGSINWVSVSMQVGEKARGEAGYLYALLLDSWTLGNIKQWDGLAQSGEYDITLPNNPPGTYYLLVGSDLDNDRTVCDEGEYCQYYPINSQIEEIVVTDSHRALGTFIMGLPELSGDVASADSPTANQGADLKTDPFPAGFSVQRH